MIPPESTELQHGDFTYLASFYSRVYIFYTYSIRRIFDPPNPSTSWQFSPWRTQRWVKIGFGKLRKNVASPIEPSFQKSMKYRYSWLYPTIISRSQSTFDPSPVSRSLVRSLTKAPMKGPPCCCPPSRRWPTSGDMPKVITICLATWPRWWHPGTQGHHGSHMKDPKS